MRNDFNPRMQNIQISPIVRISEEVREIRPDFERRHGKEFILFQRGEIDFETPEPIRSVIIKALNEGKTKYPKAGGEPGPKAALLKKLEEINGVGELNPENIVITYGGQEALQLCLHLFAERKACGFSPIWSVLIENFIPYSGIDFEEVPLNQDFSINYERLEQAVKAADLFYLNNPQNPTGKVFTQEELSEIGGICRRYGTFILADEAYEDIIFDGRRHISLASLPEMRDYPDILTAFTFSKSFAMTGLRLGYAVTRNTIAADLMRRADYTQTAGVTTAVQEAALAAYSPEVREEVDRRTRILQVRRNALFEGLVSISGLNVNKPEGAFYFYPDFSAFFPPGLKGMEEDWFIYQKCLNHGIALVPGCCFSKQGHFRTHARLSFSTTSEEKIKEGIERLKEILV